MIIRLFKVDAFGRTRETATCQVIVNDDYKLKEPPRLLEQQPLSGRIEWEWERESGEVVPVPWPNDYSVAEWGRNVDLTPAVDPFLV